MTYPVRGYIIGKGDIREYDRTFVLYTKEHGKMTVLAQGVRKITSKLCGNLEPLSEVSCLLARGKTMDRIASVEMLDRFLSIKEQLEKCSMAFYFCEVFNHLVKDGQQDTDLCELMRDFFSALHAVQVGKAGLVGSAALAKLSIVLGYQKQSKGILQSLERSQSILTFMKSRTKQECRDLLRCAQTFIHEQCEKQINSKAYFDYYASKKSWE